MTTDIALPSDKPTLSNRQQIKHDLAQYRPNFRNLLARTGMGEDEFTALITNAVRQTPKLIDCSSATILGAALRCAQLGLAPNDGRNLAWIIPRGREATFQLGYGGILELARRAVPGIRFEGRVVYAGDEFAIDYGDTGSFTHKPYLTLGTEKGEAVAWYVVAKFPDGSQQVHMLDRDGVEYHRSHSKMKNAGMWAESYDAAALKSVVMDFKRWLPSEVASPEFQAAIESDGRTIDVTEMADDDTIEVESEEVSA